MIFPSVTAMFYFNLFKLTSSKKCEKTAGREVVIATEESILAEVICPGIQTIVYKLTLRPQEFDQVVSSWNKVNAIKKRFKPRH